MGDYQDPDANTFRFRAIETPWTKGYPVAIPPFYRMLRRFRGHEYDIVHTHTPFTIGLVGLRWAESHEVPIVSTYHTLYDRYSHYVPFFPRRYVRFRIAKHTNDYYNRVQHVITPTEASARWLRRHSVTTPTSVIPTGIPGGVIYDRAEARHQLGVPPEARLLLYVGRLAREKNLLTLLRAAALVFEQEPRARLWLVGDGPYRAECRQIVRDLGIGDRVRFVGAVPREEVDRFYAAADVFVFASITETQGLVVQEAMNYGLPAIAALGGGASSSILDGGNGFAVPADAGSIAERALQVLRDDELYARLSEGAARTSRLASTGAMAERVLEVYERTIRSTDYTLPELSRPFRVR